MPSSSSSYSFPVMNPGANDIYNQLLGLNQQNYQNILGAYQGAQANMNQQLGGIYSGFDSLLGKVENTLGMGAALGQNGNWGVAGPAALAIRDSFERARGETDQGLINAGLGSTTLRGNLQNQNAMQAGQAYGNLGAQLAQSLAGYQSSLGLAGLQARQAGLGMQNQMSAAMGSTLGNYRFANTAGNLWGQQSGSSSSSGGGGGGGGGSGGGAPNGGYGSSNGEFAIGMGGGSMGYSGAYSQGGYGGYDPYGAGGGGNEMWALGGNGASGEMTNDWYSSQDYYDSNSSYSGGDSGGGDSWWG